MEDAIKLKIERVSNGYIISFDNTDEKTVLEGFDSLTEYLEFNFNLSE